SHLLSSSYFLWTSYRNIEGSRRPEFMLLDYATIC
ncbi:hypothetical protein CSUI_006813, partial [Cystoisospora suis]